MYSNTKSNNTAHTTSNTQLNPMATHSINNSNDYANKHVPHVLYRSYGDTKDVLQIVNDGSQLTVENLIDPTNPLSIHRPILITDSPTSIGMKVPTAGRTKMETTIVSNDDDDDNGMNSSLDIVTSASTTTTTTTTYIEEPITIREIGEMIGMDHPVSVMDVKTQDEMEGWIISDLVEYFEDEDRLYQTQQKIKPTRCKSSSKPRVLNQISLEFSNTLLRKYTSSPSFVRELDWIDNVWPVSKRYDNDGIDTYPRVQYYCLTSTAGCYTDFHIDFGGTSVWYHVLSAKKIFLLMPPTKQNIALYESWLCSKNQADIFFPDMKEEEDAGMVGGLNKLDSNQNQEQSLDQSDHPQLEKKMLEVESCIRVTLEQNQTFIIPTGWIHAVYTPVDSIVIGGNFLHGLDIKGQLDIHCLETRTRVPAKFRFPYFIQLMFYAGKEYTKRMIEPYGVVYREEVDGMDTLIQALRSWAVGPGGDADRNGSVAHVMRECVSEIENHGVNDLEGMLSRLELELKRIKENGGEKKRAPNIQQQDTVGTVPLSHKSQENKGPSKLSKLKLSLKRPSSSSNYDTTGNTPKINSCNFVLKVENKSIVKSKRLKIGDLASKHNIDDDEWLPKEKKAKVLKRRKPTIKRSAVENCNDGKSVESKANINNKPRKSAKSQQVKQKRFSLGAKARLKKKLGF